MSITANVVSRVLCLSLFLSPSLRFAFISFLYWKFSASMTFLFHFTTDTVRFRSFLSILFISFLFGCHHLTHEAIEHRLFSLMRKRENDFFI